MIDVIDVATYQCIGWLEPSEGLLDVDFNGDAVVAVGAIKMTVSITSSLRPACWRRMWLPRGSMRAF